MKSINDILKYGEEKLKEATEDYLIDAKLLLEFVLDKDSLYIFMNKDKDLSDAEIEKYEAVLKRRFAGEPLQYIVGQQAFMGLDFYVAPGVLIPRSDTENLVTKVIEKIKSSGYQTVLDIGTGSGAIHISLCHYLESIHCTTVDISEDAIKIAKKNAEALNVKDRVKYVKSDVFENIDETFDVIVSNPPYIPTEVIDGLQKELFHEPKIALDGGQDGYDFYRRIIKESPKYLNNHGLLAFEVGHDQSRVIEALLIEAGFIDVEIHQDLSGIERVVLARYER
ncbi:peptide chain release factor N(5)-glutamine methyltransferase [Acidaminobacter sp. JC074]|uniref:peptide chain release factor N(5)-glutamine methyltransferase n=1 Tax=Acidaminobacter sp. JC074 TaxID=2530199 RepID=UPI001F0F789E|nr:peptide chain release factor N(5)-glutamine methyltransferase [Acidaminobacter sp. JC074]MCH4889361.1 peptide chain release factor N(5)-glutamine methyltransferase [Acidaminobacter sp. JC074]